MHITLANRIKETNEYYFSKKLREIDEMNKHGEKVLNLGIGSPDLPPPAIVIETLQQAVEQPGNHGYQSYKGIPVLRAAIAEWYNRFYGVSLDPDKEVLPLIGSKEGIMHICMTYLQEGDECLIPNPGYPTYLSAVKISGAKPLFYDLEEEHEWLPDLDTLANQDLSKVKMMWINYPHMPTGAVATRAFFKRLIDFGKENQILICHDNPYSFILTDEPISILGEEGAIDVAIELNSFSKSFNMAGWRVGMLLGKEERILEILRFKSNMDSGMFYPLQAAAAKALALDDEWYRTQNKLYKERRKKVFELLDLLHCRYNPHQVGLFVWAAIPEHYQDSYSVCDAILTKARVFITPGGIFGSSGAGYIRISLCNDEEVLENVIKRIKEAGFN